MRANILSGTVHANSILNQLAKSIQNNQFSQSPSLAILQVGSHPASTVYVKKKIQTAKKIGIQIHPYQLHEQIKHSELIECIQKLNNDSAINGILVQLPLPVHINTNQVLDIIHPDKDIDGFHAINLGHLIQNKPGVIPCTPKGILYLLKTLPISLPGLQATILGRSLIVGKPLGLLLLNEHLTVTYCHSQTRNISEIARQSDILISAIGSPKMINQSYIKPGAIVIDVGINRLSTGELVGDIDFDSVAPIAGWLTPVPGGVGPMTVAMLMQNTWDSFLKQRKS